VPELKSLAREIFLAALAGIDIPAAMERKLARAGSVIHAADAAIDLGRFRTLRVAAFGKAAYAMASGLLQLLGPDFAPSGILVVPAAPAGRPARPPVPLPGFTTFLAGHPVPTGESFAAGRAILDLLAGCDDETLVFFLVSGGGSALVELPLDANVTLEAVRELNRLLVTCGAPIAEINAVRKHLSAIKGGRLAAAAPKSVKITLGVSDVPEGRESALASGPTLPDPTSVEDACRVVERYGLLARLPASIRALFDGHRLVETPKPGDPAFARSYFDLVLGRRELFHSAHIAAECRGFLTLCDNATDDWPVEKAAENLLGLLAGHRRANPGRAVAVLADGEVSSAVTGDGLGGRNTAFALCCVEKIAGQPLAVLSAGTDGIDGSSPAAGAVADGRTLERARAAGLDPRDYFRRSDSYRFFQALGDAVETGPTGNNLRDLRILLAG
jgi:glycerate 2-kinase